MTTATQPTDLKRQFRRVGGRVLFTVLMVAASISMIRALVKEIFLH